MHTFWCFRKCLQSSNCKQIVNPLNTTKNRKFFTQHLKFSCFNIATQMRTTQTRGITLWSRLTVHSFRSTKDTGHIQSYLHTVFNSQYNQPLISTNLLTVSQKLSADYLALIILLNLTDQRADRLAIVLIIYVFCPISCNRGRCCWCLRQLRCIHPVANHHFSSNSLFYSTACSNWQFTKAAFYWQTHLNCFSVLRQNPSVWWMFGPICISSTNQTARIAVWNANNPRVLANWSNALRVE